MKFVGIDVGVTGAMAFVDQQGHYQEVFDLPVELVRYAEKGKEHTRLDVRRFVHYLAFVGCQDVVVTELLWANSSNGALASFGLGKTFGAVESSLTWHCAATKHFVSPLKWKNHFRLGKDKKAALRTARALFPDAPLHLEQHHNRAEALLIARYGSEVYRR
ncbi:MAG: hypothetical protein R3B95_11745 [Nitrospirales bacterium]|nr:hypothetical protein [Nitrospirales bacterium]